MICMDCGQVLTDEEAHYYGSRCGACERDWPDAIDAWRHGAANPEFDRMFGQVEPRTLQ